MSLQWKSPAKINLNLKVLGKRADGYHQLSSIFQAVSLFDDIQICESDKDFFSTTDKSIPSDERNLVVRALQLFKRVTNSPRCWNIHLIKRIPIEAGLGGGSSNCATTLFALNELHGFPLTIENLRQLGAELGSDVPFFFSTGTAYVTGRGEEVVSVPKNVQGPITLVKPPFGLSTPLVFKEWKAPLETLQDDTLNNYLKGQLQFMNDLELPAFVVNPHLSYLKEQLQSCGFDQVVMTGSGTCFFCLGRGKVPYFDGYKMFITTPIHREEGEWYFEDEEEVEQEGAVVDENL